MKKEKKKPEDLTRRSSHEKVEVLLKEASDYSKRADVVLIESVLRKSGRPEDYLLEEL